MNVAPFLPCAKCAAATLHIFIETRARPRRPGKIPYLDCIYECDVCHETRPWGNKPRDATIYGRRLSDALFVHALERHGMRWEKCPRCRGMGNDCAECGDEGETWIFGSLAPCGPGCLIEDLEQPVDE
jgi:hypothetical protein